MSAEAARVLVVVVVALRAYSSTSAGSCKEHDGEVRQSTDLVVDVQVRIVEKAATLLNK